MSEQDLAPHFDVRSADGSVIAAQRIAGPTANAATVVLAHSLGCSQAMWAPQIDALRQHFQVLRYDLRGHGQSAAPDGDYTLAQLGEDALAVIATAAAADVGVDATSRAAARPVHFVGLSLGGMVGMWLAAHHPQRLARLVLANTTPFIPLRDMFNQRIASARSVGLQGIAAPTMDRWLGPRFKAQHATQRDALVAAMAAMPVAGYAGCCAVLRDADQRASILQIQSPTLVITGADDLATPLAAAQQLAAAIPGASWACVDNAGHLSNLENPEAFNTLLCQHLLA